jgi:hypothetical protein
VTAREGGLPQRTQRFAEGEESFPVAILGVFCGFWGFFTELRGQPTVAGESDPRGTGRVHHRGSAPETPTFCALRQQHGRRAPHA